MAVHWGGRGPGHLSRYTAGVRSPFTIFGSGLKVWHDVWDPSTIFQDTAGTIPALFGSRVALLMDKSGNNIHMSQPTTAQQPFYGRVPRGGRRNLLTYSEQFNQNLPWIPLGTAGGSVAANATAAPDGMSTADKFTVGTGTGSWYIANYANISITSGQAYTFSAYVKSAGLNYVFVRPHNNSVSIGQSGFIISLTDGTITYPSAPAAPASTGTATNVGNGWWRITATSTANATTTTSGGPGVWPVASTAFAVANGQVPANFTGDGTSGIYLWGAQLESGSAATNYQKVVRPYDVTEAGVPSVPCLYSDGVDDGMVTPPLDLSGTDKLAVFTAVEKMSDAAQAMAIEFGVGGAGSFSLQAPNGAGADRYVFSSTGSGLVSANANGFVAPNTAVIAGLGNISGDQCIIRVNGAQVAQSTADQGSGNYGNYPIYYFRRGGSSLPFSGYWFGDMIFAGAPSDAQIAWAEKFYNSQLGAYA